MHRWRITGWARRQPIVSRRILPLVVAMMGCLVAAYVAFGVSRWTTPISVQAAVPGMASVSGTVESSTPFRAAQVFLRNTDKRILNMVFTSGGQFRATPLFPGNYEVSVATKGSVSDVQKLVLKAGDN